MQLIFPSFFYRWFRWLEWINILGELEFRIFHEIFCDQHHFQRFVFAFDVYVERVFERYLLEILTIQPLDWFLVCCLTWANHGRKNGKVELFHCGEFDSECHLRNDLIIFTVSGAHIFDKEIFSLKGKTI